MQTQLCSSRSSYVRARCSHQAPAVALLPYVQPSARSAVPRGGGSLPKKRQITLSILLQRREQHHTCQAASSSSGDSSSSSSSSSSGSSSSSQPQQSAGPPLNWFDRLPPKVQLGIVGGLLFVGMFLIPFLQPTFLYGDGAKQSVGTQQGIAEVKQADPSYTEKYKLPRYIPGASELYDFLQDNAMPRKLPDGRSESPGVLRIYLCSMIILGLFYACSAVVSLILNGVAGVLRAVGVMGPQPPKPKEE